jgi:hypothetical protein
MSHFQVPDDRVLHAPDSGLQPWPAAAEGYRLFTKGSVGEEKIGIQVGQAIQLQLIGGKDCSIESYQGSGARSDSDNASEYLLAPFRVNSATSDRQRLTVTSDQPGRMRLQARDAAGNLKAALEVMFGDFQPSTDKDLIADIMRGGDSLKIHALQRMLNNNLDNIFEQKAPANSHAQFGNMTCGLVAKFRGDQIFGKLATVEHDWYKHSIHEPLARRVAARSDLKYRPERIARLKTQIAAALADGKAVRVGVIDAPIGMPVVNGKLIAYHTGGHTVLIVGCNEAQTEFMYIDPWGNGTSMEYKGGIAGNKFPHACRHLGLFVLTNDSDRRVTGDDGSRPNIMRQSRLTEGTFSEARGNFLEVVSAPFPVAGG